MLSGRKVVLLALALAVTLDARWLKLETGPFTLYTEGSESSARRVLMELDQARFAFHAISGSRNPLPLPVRVYVLSEGLFRAVRPGRITRGFYQSAPERDSIVIPSGLVGSRVLLHEFTHLVMHHTLGPIPQWLEEGLAEVHSTLKVEQNRVRLGEPIREHVRYLATVPLLTGSELAAVDKQSRLYNEDERTGTFYAQSWALVHMLRCDERYRRGFASFLAALDGGESQAAAFQRAFGKSMSEAVAELPNYLARSTVAVLEIPVRLPAAQAEPRLVSLEPFEADFAYAELASETGHPEEAEPVYRRALRDASGESRVEYLLGLHALLQNRRDEALAHFERATTAPDAAADAYFEYAMLLRDSGGAPERVKELLEKTVERNPQYAEAHFILGAAEASEGHHDIALPHLERAASIFPRQSYFWHALALSYHALGRDKDSRRAAQRALDSASNSEQAEMARAALRLGESATMEVEKKPAVTTPESWSNPKGDRRIEGVLERIDCLGTPARFLVRTGEKSIPLLVENPGAVLLKNLSSVTFEFRCGPQKPAPVVVEYQSHPDNKTGTAGVVTSIEFR